jgi:tetratricopeptide (TPR) repeat protein
MTTTHQDFDLCLEKTAQNEFVAYVPDDDGGRAAEHAFTLRTDTLKMRENLQRLEVYSLHKELVKDDFHVRFGRMLYQAALGGEVGALFAERLATAQNDDLGLRLRVRIATEGERAAPELMNLPWEFLHDGDGFLVTHWETPVSRLPLGIARRDKRPLERVLRMLVVVSSPLNLPEHRVLNTEREQEVILAALDKLQRKGSLDIDFCEDAALDTIQDYLSELEYDILHFTGHGVFDEAKGRGELLLEDEQGNMQPLTNAEFAALLRGYPSLRLVVLSACQSARTANNDAYADLARILLKQGMPAVLAMQYSVLDQAATLFAGRFYTGLANNKPLDVALTEARLALRLGSGQDLQMARGEEDGERVDFATPVLFLNDPTCVSVAQVRPEAEEVRLERPVDWSTVSVMEKGFVGRRRELRRIRHGFTSGRQRAFIIHGLGGIGKSVLTTRAATKLRKNFAGVKAVRLTATTRPEDILSELNAFLNLAGVNAFNQVIHAPMSLEAKTGVMAQILTQVPLLLIFDNFEDVLRKGQMVREGVKSKGVKRKSVKREGVKRDLDEIADPALAEFFEQLVKSVAQGSRFLFTTRYDFDPARGRLTGEIEHISLGELPFPMAVQCMNNHDVLAPLPVVPPSVGAGGTPAQVPPLTKRELCGKLGGHPYTIDVFARRARVTGVADVWLEIEDVEQEMIEFTLLDRTYAQLPLRAQTLLLRASVLEEAPPLEALQWMMGDGDDAMPAIDAELKALLGSGMLSRQETGRGEVVYPMHALVRDYARRQLADSTEGETALLLRAARFWELQADQTEYLDQDVFHRLRARDYYYRAGEYEKAFWIVHSATEPMIRWGFLEQLIGLLDESIETLEGTGKATAMGNLATVYQVMGDYKMALKMHEQVKALFEAQGDKENVAISLHLIGMIYQQQGNYSEAQARYKQALEIFGELGDKSKIAKSYGQLGNLHLDQGNLDAARARYEDGLQISIECGDKAIMARFLHQLGRIHLEQENLGEAQARYKQALEIFGELGAKSAIAQSLHSLGVIHQLQGNPGEAQAKYEQGLKIRMELGDKLGVSQSLHQLGMIHQDQGNLGEAQAKYEQSLALKVEMGDKRGIAASLHQLGSIHQEQGSYCEALEKYVQALMLLEQLGSPDAAKARRSLALLREEMGGEAFAAALAELEARAGGVPETGAATLEQAADMVVQNTVAVMTEAPKQREEWWGSLGQLQAQARQHGDAGFAAFLGAVQQVVEGMDPARVRVELEEPFMEAWGRLVEGLQQRTWELNELD